MLSDERSTNRTSTILDACNQGDEICDRGYTQEQESRLNPTTDKYSREGDYGKQRNKIRNQKQKILDFLFHFPTSPILSIVKTKQWLNSEFAYIGRRNKTFKNCCDIFYRKICNYKIKEFLTLYNNSEPLFGALSGTIEEEYYDRIESLTRLENLLLYQFFTIDAVCDFLKIIYNHINKQSGKKNCIQITGPPSSGKTYFINIISSFLLSKGQIRNFNKFDNFPLNDCVDKRILIWDEPNYERGALEQIKLLFSGDKCPANVKYENEVQIDRTPIYVTCNTDVFPNNDEFNCRMYKFIWQTLPVININVKQIYPLTLTDIFQKYGII